MGRIIPGHKQKGPKVPSNDRRMERDPGCPPGTDNALNGWAGTAIRIPLGASRARAALGELGTPFSAPEPGGRGARRAPGPTRGKPQVSARRGAGAKTEYPGGCHGARRATEPSPSHPRPQVPQARPPHAGGLSVLRQVPRGCPDSSLTSAQPGYTAPVPLPLPPRPAPRPRPAPTHRRRLRGKFGDAAAAAAWLLGAPWPRRDGGRGAEGAGAGGGSGGREGARRRPAPASLQRLRLRLALPGPPRAGRGRQAGAWARTARPTVRPRVGAAPAGQPSLRLCAVGPLFRFAERGEIRGRTSVRTEGRQTEIEVSPDKEAGLEMQRRRCWAKSAADRLIDKHIE